MKRNTIHRWGSVSIALHWTIAALILAVQVPLGLTMTAIGQGATQNLLFTAHKMAGILIFVLAVIRLGWRATTRTPELPPDLAPWQAGLARTTHWLLYVLLFAMPLTGFFYTAFGGYPVPLFGLGDLGAVVATNKPVAELFKATHLYLQYALYTVVALHVAGALQHHFGRQDGILERMISSTKPLPPMTSSETRQERARNAADDKAAPHTPGLS
jgi:cytochrome b561